jgi:hypothetical protein
MSSASVLTFSSAGDCPTPVASQLTSTGFHYTILAPLRSIDQLPGWRPSRTNRLLFSLPHVEKGSNNSTVALRGLGGDEKGTKCPGV